MHAIAESGRDPKSKHQIQPEFGDWNKTAKPISRDQIIRRERVQGNIRFPVRLTTSRIVELTRLMHTLLYKMALRTTYIHAQIRYATLSSPRKDTDQSMSNQFIKSTNLPFLHRAKPGSTWSGCCCCLQTFSSLPAKRESQFLQRSTI